MARKIADTALMAACCSLQPKVILLIGTMLRPPTQQLGIHGLQSLLVGMLIHLVGLDGNNNPVTARLLA